MIKNRRIYYYCVAPYGDTFSVIGPFDDERIANEKGMEKLHGVFEVFTSRHGDLAKATQEVKFQRLNETADLGESLKRMRHTV